MGHQQVNLEDEEEEVGPTTSSLESVEDANLDSSKAVMVAQR